MKKIILCLLTLASPIAMAEHIDMSLNATKNDAGLGERLLTLKPKQTYQFNCILSPKQIPPAGTIFLDITVCDTNQLHNCPYAYAQGHADLKQPAVKFQFSPQSQYIGEKSNFWVIMQYIPLNGDQTVVARYQLSCDYYAWGQSSNREK